MRAIRSRVIALSLCGLVCQVLLLGAPLAETLLAATPGGAAQQCLCDAAGSAHAMCPMHHSPAQKKESSDAKCRLSQAPSFGMSLVLTPGALPEPPQDLASIVSTRVAIIDHASPLVTRSIGFDPPPPRS